MALILGSVAPTSAQFESYLEKVTDLHFSLSCWQSASELRTSSCPSTSGYGLEILWNLGTIPWGNRHPLEPTKKLVRVEVARGPNGITTDSIFEITARPDSTKEYAVIELGLGYSQFSGLRSTDSSYQLYGTVRELPAVSVYLSFPTVWSRGTPYLAARTGLIRLQNAQLVGPPMTDSTSTAYVGSAEAFQLGAALGLAVGPRRLQGTIELAYHWRNFPSVLWSGQTAVLPTQFPTDLNLSGPSLALGIQVKLR